MGVFLCAGESTYGFNYMGGKYFVAQLSWEMYPWQLKITFKMNIINVYLI